MIGAAPLLGAAAGGAAGGLMGGGGLGQLLYPLDLPRRALWSPIQKAVQGGSLLSALPAAGGVATGLMAGMIPGPWTPFAPQIGVGTAGVLQGLMEMIDPGTYHSPSAGDVAGMIGMDPHNPLHAMAAGALDPMLAAGIAGGLGLGKHVAREGAGLAARQSGSTARLAAEGNVAREAALLDELSQAAAMEPKLAAQSQWIDQLKDTLPAGQQLPQYRPDLIAALPTVAGEGGVAPGMAGKVYKQVEPALLGDLEALGHGVPRGKGMQLVGPQAPDFTRSSGGWLQPAFEETTHLGAVGSQHPLKSVSYLGPQNVPPSMADGGWLAGGNQSLESMRAGTGLTGPQWTPPARQFTTAQMLGPDRTEALLQQLGKDAIVPLPGGKQGYFTQLPPGQAPGFAAGRLDRARAALDAIPASDAPLTVTQQLLLRFGLA